MRFMYMSMIVTAAVLAGCAAVAERPAAKDGYAYRAFALQGDLSGAEAGLATHDPQSDLLQRFRARFLERTDGIDLAGVEAPLIRQLGELYQDYWRQALVEPDRRESLEDALGRDVRQLILEYLPSYPESSEDDVFNHVADAIGEHGYKAIGGRTPPLLELIVWRRNREAVVDVELTDGTHRIPITYQEDFLIRGWAHFATFGQSSAGGWATPEGLHCVADAYDLASENFLVSFLKHEARHFVDYSKYPALAAADLEYRAKLTELVFARETAAALLERFSRNAARVDNSPHALANWHVDRNLRLKLAPDGRPELAWGALDTAGVASAAKELLRENDRDLAAAGALTTKGVILP
ncbi:MAG: hypothetical protein AAFX56_01930 [Pseudomonadota bacterium]